MYERKNDTLDKSTYLCHKTNDDALRAQIDFDVISVGRTALKLLSYWAKCVEFILVSMNSKSFPSSAYYHDLLPNVNHLTFVDSHRRMNAYQKLATYQFMHLTRWKKPEPIGENEHRKAVLNKSTLNLYLCDINKRQTTIKHMFNWMKMKFWVLFSMMNNKLDTWCIKSNDYK